MALEKRNYHTVRNAIDYSKAPTFSEETIREQWYKWRRLYEKNKEENKPEVDEYVKNYFQEIEKMRLQTFYIIRDAIFFSRASTLWNIAKNKSYKWGKRIKYSSMQNKISNNMKYLKTQEKKYSYILEFTIILTQQFMIEIIASYNKHEQELHPIIWQKCRNRKYDLLEKSYQLMYWVSDWKSKSKFQTWIYNLVSQVLPFLQDKNRSTKKKFSRTKQLIKSKATYSQSYLNSLAKRKLILRWNRNGSQSIKKRLLQEKFSSGSIYSKQELFTECVYNLVRFLYKPCFLIHTDNVEQFSSHIESFTRNKKRQMEYMMSSKKWSYENIDHFVSQKYWTAKMYISLYYSADNTAIMQSVAHQINSLLESSNVNYHSIQLNSLRKYKDNIWSIFKDFLLASGA